MLTDLHIENIAVIEKSDVAFGPGFNVLTGETGAGKSIVIDAIGAVLGGRVSRELVRAGAQNALVSAVFTDCDVGNWFTENDIEPGDEIILQRRISADGKSACRVCGVPVTAQQMRALGGRLLDIHGQNDGRQLLDETRHQDYLDRFAADDAEKGAYDAAYSAWRALKKEIDRLSMDELEKARLTEQLEAEVQELEKARLRPGEEEELRALHERMKNAGQLTEAVTAAYAALYENDDNAIALTGEAERAVTAAAALAPELKAASESVAQARFLLEDAAERLNDLRASLDFSEEEYNDTENRLGLLRKLQRKYALDEAGLAARLEEDRRRLTELESSDDLLIQLEKDLKKARDAVLAAGGALTRKRQSASKTLAKRIQAELKYLNMPSVSFVTEITPKQGAEGFDATGCDEVRFLMSANAGSAPGRIAHIASGGELSRIMLALKSVFAENDAVGTLIFDEIDTGVSGITAQRVGEKMGMLSKRRQLLCVTHLPQIAAMADSHYCIEKREKGGMTYTTVTALDHEGRVRELARLHGGDAVTDTTLKSAEEQLAAAERFKTGEG
ncbi:MAG: DNA repair protein RecN [Oscillospiraceae bacterium]|nr:DNA repair protein RecN [Oscillospiraceae bacterium]